MDAERIKQLERVAHAARCTVSAWLEDRIRPFDHARTPEELCGVRILVNLLRQLDRLDKEQAQ